MNGSQNFPLIYHKSMFSLLFGKRIDNQFQDFLFVPKRHSVFGKTGHLGKGAADQQRLTAEDLVDFEVRLFIKLKIS